MARNINLYFRVQTPGSTGAIDSKHILVGFRRTRVEVGREAACQC